MAGTSLALVKAGLVSTLAAALPGTQVDYGPTPQGAPDSLVMVGDVNGTVEPAAFGPNRPRRETYQVQVIFSVSKVGKAVQQAATEAVVALYDAAQLALRGISSENLLGPGSSVESARFTGQVLLQESLTRDGNNATVRATLEVRARVV